MSRPIPSLLVTATAVLAATLAVAGAVAAGVPTVSQKSRAFGVRDLQIAKGDTVRFTNDDSFIHQVYVRAAAMKFESREQEPGQVVDVLFPAFGNFEVRCEIHPKMLLNVSVR